MCEGVLTCARARGADSIKDLHWLFPISSKGSYWTWSLSCWQDWFISEPLDPPVSQAHGEGQEQLFKVWDEGWGRGSSSQLYLVRVIGVHYLRACEGQGQLSLGQWGVGPTQQGPYILTHGSTHGPTHGSTLDHMRSCGNNGQWCIVAPWAMDIGIDPSCGKIVLSNFLSPDVTMAQGDCTGLSDQQGGPRWQPRPRASAWPSLVTGAMDISTDLGTVGPQTHCSPGLGMDATMAPGDSVVYSNLYDPCGNMTLRSQYGLWYPGHVCGLRW